LPETDFPPALCDAGITEPNKRPPALLYALLYATTDPAITLHLFPREILMDEQSQGLTVSHKIATVWILSAVMMMVLSGIFSALGIVIFMGLDIKGDIADLAKDQQGDLGKIYGVLEMLDERSDTNEEALEELDERVRSTEEELKLEEPN